MSKHDEITREFWKRVHARNNVAPECVPPPRVPVEIDEDRPPLAVVAIVSVMFFGALAFGVYALGRHFGWISALVAVLAAAFAPVGRRS